MRETLQLYVVARMIEALRAASGTSSAQYRALRAYSMLGEKTRYDRMTVLAWVDDDASRMNLSERERAAWLAHAAAWAAPDALAPHVALDAELVAAAREQLRAQPEAQRVFDAILPRLSAAMPEPLSLADMAGPGAPLVFSRKSGARLSDGVPGPYTLAAINRYLVLRDAALAQEGRDAWVLDGAHAGPAYSRTLADDVDHLYFTAYVQAWDAMIGDIALRPLPLPRAGDDVAFVALLAGPESPLRLFLVRAAKETTLEHTARAPVAARAASGAWDAVGRKVRAWFRTPKTLTPTPGEYSRKTAALVDRHFDALHRLVSGASASVASGAGALDRVQAQLREVAVYLRAAGIARASGLPAPPGDALEGLEQSPAAAPAPLGDMLDALARDGTATAKSAQRTRIDERWRADIGPFCRTATDGRYPFVSSGDADVTPDDFTRLFASGGLLDTFFRTYLQPYVDTATVPWTWRVQLAPPGMSNAALHEFERAARIREAFFPGQGKTMEVRFTVMPRDMDAGLTRFALSYGGQSLDYTHGPPQAATFDWPDRTGPQVASIDYAPVRTDGRHGVETHGAWSLFRLLDRGQLDARAADRFELTFALDGRGVTLDLLASSVTNPFALPAVRAFRCPSGI
ncbi:type VI secretion system membrane subunit TssM [Trinickia acidisoli]|uniref:type VI secretion system membrane subunit TssM n=1 Tax=Trinickia acidisoli TaxID=2767482 RepID=UPI001A8DCF79|nr:type VI secretion system membrane subunit TssM [Trinickia acidisoli]